METINKIRTFQPKTICFSQYGAHGDADHVIEEATRLLDDADEFIKNRVAQGLEPEKIIEEMLTDTAIDRWGGKEEALYMITSLVLGFVAYYRRREDKAE